VAVATWAALRGVGMGADVVVGSNCHTTMAARTSNSSTAASDSTATTRCSALPSSASTSPSTFACGGARPQVATWPSMQVATPLISISLAIEAQATAERRVNLGGSPGDGSCDEPYLYVGPWTADRPGDPEFWNADFGAMRTRTQLAADPAGLVAAGAAFLLEGYNRLR